MRPKGSASQLEYRRHLAASLLSRGKSIHEVARLVGASPSSVHRWKQTIQQGGLEALTAKPHPGRRPRLSNQQKADLVQILLQGPHASGYQTDLWTCQRVTEVIRRTFDVHYHPAHVWRLLQSLGWRCRKPER